MSHTAYSETFGDELDLKQLLKRRRVIAVIDQEDFGLSSSERAWMRSDLRCPSCRCAGASIVRSDVAKPGKVNTRQAHFRFLDASGRSAHAAGCDFYALDDEPGFTRGVDVRFSADDKDTRIVRGLVCRAIAIGALTKPGLFAMRTTFLQHKAANTFLVNGTPARIDWLYGLYNLAAQPLAFAPFHADLPGFSLRRAADRQLAFHYRDFRPQIPRVGFDARVRDRAKRLVTLHQGQGLVSMISLQPQYELTLTLARLMSELGQLPLSKPGRGDYRWTHAPPALLALSAALLFASNWVLDEALSRFAQILAAPTPQDMTLGNVMGLNPFHDFAALEIVRFAAGLRPESTFIYDFDAERTATTAHIQAVWLNRPQTA